MGKQKQIHHKAAKAAANPPHGGAPSSFDEKTPQKVNGTVDPGQGIQLPKSIKGKG